MDDLCGGCLIRQALAFTPAEKKRERAIAADLALIYFLSGDCLFPGLQRRKIIIKAAASLFSAEKPARRRDAAKKEKMEII